MKRRSGGGSSSVGRGLKKAKKEERTIVFIDESGLSERPQRCRTWGTKGTHAGAAISFQLEDAVGDGGSDVVELLFPIVSRRNSKPADSSFCPICCGIFRASC